MKILFRIGIAWVPVYFIATGLLYALKAVAPDLPFYVQTLIMTGILVSLMVTVVVPKVVLITNRVFDKTTN